MVKQKRNRNNLIAISGAAALLAVAVNFAISAFNKNNNRKKKEVPGSNVRVNLSASEILKLAESIINKSKQVHDTVASVPLDKVSYANVILPLAELEVQQFPLIQSCIFPKWLSPSGDVRKASSEAERKIDAHIAVCRKREDVYRVIKALTVTTDGMSTDAKSFTRFLVQDLKLFFFFYPIFAIYFSLLAVWSFKSLRNHEKLQRRGFQICSRCFLCDLEVENNSHLFIHCNVTTKLWNMFICMSGVSWVMPNTSMELLENWNGSGYGIRSRNAWRIIPGCIWWTVWNERNKRCFEDKESSGQKIKMNCLALYYFWCKQETLEDTGDLLEVLGSLQLT